MARRKRKEEEPAFAPPEFDEVEYMRREIAGAKTSILVVLWAIAGALLAYGLVLAGAHWALAFLVGLGVVVGLNFVLPTFGVRSDKFQRRDWFGHGATYFFSWLAFWILLLNAPFSDFTSPTVHGILVGTYAGAPDTTPGAGTVACVAATGSTVSLPFDSNMTILVIFRATDNVQVNGIVARAFGNPIAVDPVSGQSHACSSHVNQTYPNDTHALRIPISGNTVPIEIVATDPRGHTSPTVSFTVLNSA